MRKLSLILAILFIIPLNAQHGDAILSGIVRNRDNGDTVRDFSISLFNVETEARFYYESSRHNSDSNRIIGFYEFRGIPPGIYVLSCIGWDIFGQQIIRNVVLKEGFNNWYPRVAAFPVLAPRDHYSNVRYYEEEYYEIELSEIELEQGLNLYPNPVRSTAHLVEAEFYDEAQILSLSGTVLKTIHFKEGAAREMDLSELPFGIYLCKLNASKYSMSKVIKFLKI
jgi:hypothetical protein